VGVGSPQSPVNGSLPQTLNEGFGDYVLIPSGSFLMGDNFDEGDADETPVHAVSLDDFYIARHKVTNADFARFIGAGGYTEPSYWTAGGFGEYGSAPRHWKSEKYHGGGTEGGDGFPVVGVSWFEASAYCSWISTIPSADRSRVGKGSQRH
jgi:iron(II)-dependent oxidoreductase